MATISSTGIGSGLDVESIVTKLVALERNPLKSLANQATNVNAQISAMGDVQSKFATLSDVATRISTTSAWVARTAASSNTSAATISVTSSAAATAFTLDVDALAQKQATSSPAMAAGSYVGAGTLTFRLGAWTPVGTDAGTDNTGVANADAALPVAQAALTTAQNNLTTANATLTTANTALTGADSTLATATSDANTANATLASTTGTYNAAVTAFNAAEATRSASEATLASANTSATNTAAAASAAQTFLDNVTAASPADISTAQANFDAADAALTSATATAGTALSDSNTADATWATASGTAATATATLANANSALVSTTPALSNANATLATANSQFSVAAAANTAADAATAALEDDQTASTALTNYAAANPSNAELTAYAQKYADWVAAIAANDHVAPGLQTTESTARADMLNARSTLSLADPAARTTADDITAPADATNSSLLKGQAIDSASLAGTTPSGAAAAKATALANQAAASAAAATATTNYNNAFSAQSAAVTTSATANANLATATSDKASKAAALGAANAAVVAATSDKAAKASLLADSNNAVATATTARDATAATASTAASAQSAAQTARDNATTAAASENTAVGVANSDNLAAAADAASKGSLLATATTDRANAQAAVTAAGSAVTAATTAATNATTAVANATSGITTLRPTFAPGSGSSDFTVTATATDTVATLAAKINAANGGVVATAFFDGTQDRLQLTSKSTGAAAGFRVQASDSGDGNNTDNAGVSRFAYDPQTSAFGMASAGITAKYGQDAKARINGLVVTSSTNSLTTNLTGVTVDLKATTTTGYGTPGEVKSSVSMTISEDVTVAVKNINDFIAAYNDVTKMLGDLTKYDAKTKRASLFQGDSTVLGMQNVLRSIQSSISNGSSTYQRLADIGVERQLDGTLTMNTNKLSVAANNGSEVQKLFTSSTGTALTNGFAVKFASFASGALKVGGAVINKEKALQLQLNNNTKEQTKVNDRASSVEARLRKTYTSLDSKMASLNALNAYVAQQVTTWNKSTG